MKIGVSGCPLETGEIMGDKVYPLVSVITVTKNSEQYLEDSIKSVITQTYKNIEYLIIDGMSEDSTVDIIKKHEEFIDYWVSESDENMYDAINKGIKVSNGDVIAILNSDDCYTNDEVIRHVIERFLEFGVDGVYGDLIVDYGNFKKYKKVFQVSFYDYLIAGKGTFVPHPTLFITRKCIDRIGLYDKKYKYAADYDFILRCLHSCKIKYLSMPITVFRRHPGSITATGKIKEERLSILNTYSVFCYSLNKNVLHKSWLWIKYYVLNVVWRVFMVCRFLRNND